MASTTRPLLNGQGTSSVILAYIPETARTRFFEDLIGSLQPNNHSGMDFVASLVVQYSQEEPKQEFLSFLERVVRTTNIQSAVSVSLQHEQLGNELLEKIVEYIVKDKSSTEEIELDQNVLQSHLRFAKSVVSHLPAGPTQSKLFRRCLDLLNTSHKDTCICATDVVFTLLSTYNKNTANDAIELHQQHLWETIRALVNCKDEKFRTLTAYSLWLRSILSQRRMILDVLGTNEYWQLLLEGLRHGDTERRKIYLNILKLSVDTDAAAVSESNRRHYDRYCTVFETIVLGQYINQVHECEQDLNSLMSDNTVEPKWLFTLLASTLDRQMPESNRKFIGNWVMQSGLTITDEFERFFKDDFLPWATQGQHFVSTLKERSGVIHCLHGDRLTGFIRRLRDDGIKASQLADIVLQTIRRKSNSIFPYAAVFLLEGLGDSILGKDTEFLVGLRKAPEVARDYISSKITNAVVSDSSTPTPSRKQILEQRALEKCRDFDPEHGEIGELWGEVEYLEYPKRLLMMMPDILFQSKVIHRATTDLELATILSEKLHVLQNISETKTFLLPPLIRAVRKAVLTTPETVDVLDIAEFIIRIANHPPKPSVDLMLEEATIPLTSHDREHYFGDSLSIGYATLLDLLSRLWEHDRLVKRIALCVIGQWKTQRVPPPSVTTWKTTLQLQVLLLCLEDVPIDSITESGGILDDLFYILSLEPLPRYRYLLEWIIARWIDHVGLQDTIFAKLRTKDHHSNPKFLASLMKISTVLACGHFLADERSGEFPPTKFEEKRRPEFALELATILISMAASSKVVIRHEAQWQFPTLMDHARTKDWEAIATNPAFIALDDYIRSLERFDNPPPERQVGRFRPETDHTLSNLVDGRWYELDSTEGPLTNQKDMTKLYHSERPKGVVSPCLVLGEAVKRSLTQGPDLVGNLTSDKTIMGPKPSEDVPALQTKGTAYLARALVDPVPNDSDSKNLIVVGSLVENPYNLGGLSRVSEIFGASALTLRNRNVLSNKDFTSVSVSSHLHLPIVQLSAAAVPGYLAERKQEGFTIVGIEQTDRSVMLGTGDAKLPEKVVLVVGSEKEGIPAEALTECDLLVEIPQKGVTRSLNVQTAASIVLYEHVRQQRSDIT